MVSVIMPVYNAEKFLDASINSVIQQVYEDWELLIILNGCTDNSRSICEKYQKVDKRLHIYSIDEANVSKARNLGIVHAKGSHILFLDSDDALHPSCLEKLVSYALQSGCDVISFDFYQSEEASNCNTKLKGEILEIAHTNDEIKKFLLGNSKIKKVVCGNLYKAELISAIWFKEDLSLGEDICFQLEALCKSTKLAIMKDKLYNNRIRVNSLSRSRVNLSTIENIRLTNCYRTKIIEDYMRELKEYAEVSNCMNYLSWINRSMIQIDGDHYVTILKEELKSQWHIVNKKLMGIKKVMEIYLVFYLPFLYKQILGTRLKSL